MLLLAKVLTGAVFLIHVYIVLIETVLFEKRGKKIFRVTEDPAGRIKTLLSNQGCYNGFLAAALLLGLLYPEPLAAKAFIYYGLGCVAVAGVWGAVTAQRRILFIQTAPAVLALAAWLLV